MSRRRVSNLLALAVLSCLSEKPMHPYEISSTLRSRGKEHSIKLNYGALYSVVAALEKHGLIEHQETVREGRRPERTVYAITEEGVAEFQDWLAELLSSPVREYTSLEAALSLFAGLPPEEVVRLLGERVTRLKMEIGAADASLRVAEEQGVPEVFVVETQYRRALLQAELTFTSELTERIGSEKLGGTTLWRRLHELQRQGVQIHEVFADPTRYLGEEASTVTALLNNNSS